MTLDDTIKRAAVLALLSRGLLNPSEAARLAGTSRQLVTHWCKQDKINWRRARGAYLKAEWQRELNG